MATQNQTVAPAPLPSVAIGEDSAGWRRDPFIGKIKKSAAFTSTKAIPLKTGAGHQNREQLQVDIQLQGIMQADKKFHALINGRSVKAGDMIDGVTIKEISRYRVVVLNDRKEKIIYDIYQGRIDRGVK